MPPGDRRESKRRTQFRVVTALACAVLVATVGLLTNALISEPPTADVSAIELSSPAPASSDRSRKRPTPTPTPRKRRPEATPTATPTPTPASTAEPGGFAPPTADDDPEDDPFEDDDADDDGD